MKSFLRNTLLFFFVLVCTASRAVVSHEWTAYPALGEISYVVKGGDEIYALAGGSLFSVSTSDYSVVVYDKTTVLSDTEISLIEWCSSAKRLVIVYSNQNIDLLSTDGTVVNIPDLYSKVMTADKTVNSIDIYGNDAYLSTNFGIVNLNVAKAEVTNTYNLDMAVMWCHIEDGHIYAETTSNGQYSALLTDNLLDPAVWKQTSTTSTKKTLTIDPDLLAMAEAYRPNAPYIDYFGFMRFQDGKLYTVQGYGGATEREAAVQILSGDEWNVIVGDTGYDAEPRYRALCTIDVDPTNKYRWLVGAIPGLYEYTNGKITNCYYWKNSILERAASVETTNVDYTQVTALRFDSQGNAWIVQSGVPTAGVICFTHDGQFIRYEHPEMIMPSYGYSWARVFNLDYSSTGLLWFVNNDWRAPALASYDTATDRLTTYTTFINEDSSVMDVLYVRCWAEDKDGNIWIGTNAGPAYLSRQDISSGGDTFNQPKIPREDDPTLADYLLSGVDISCMAVDAGNRKWFGTNGEGVYVISSDNMVQEEHFLSSTSDLLSDNIERIVIDDSTGMVYIGTDKGLCSYASSVTETMPTLEKDNVYAYPNPVGPDYDGPVTIVGLTYGAQVRITTTSGHLVKRGTSTGGSYLWDCTDEKGRKVASGVYFVLVSTEDGKNGLACKVAVVR